MQHTVRPGSGRCPMWGRGMKTESDLGDGGTPACAGRQVESHVASVSALSVLQTLTHRRRNISYFMLVTPPANSAVEQLGIRPCQVSNSHS